MKQAVVKIAEALNMMDNPVYHQLLGERLVMRRRHRQDTKTWADKYKKFKSGTNDLHIGEDTRDTTKTK